MNRIFLMLLFNVTFVHILCSQTLVQKIEKTYHGLDSEIYLKNMILSYRNNLVVRHNGYKERKNIMTTIDDIIFFQGKNQIIDSVWEKLPDQLKISIDKDVDEFRAMITSSPPIYVLNLIMQDKQALKVDTGKLLFNLFYFKKINKGDLYIFCENGQYSWQDSRYRTFSKKIGENAPRVFKKILRKNPKYLLYCYDLEQMNTILYMLNDKIYVHRIAQMEEYELSEYMKKFRP